MKFFVFGLFLGILAILFISVSKAQLTSCVGPCDASCEADRATCSDSEETCQAALDACFDDCRTQCRLQCINDRGAVCESDRSSCLVTEGPPAIIAAFCTVIFEGCRASTFAACSVGTVEELASNAQQNLERQMNSVAVAISQTVTDMSRMAGEMSAAAVALEDRVASSLQETEGELITAVQTAEGQLVPVIQADAAIVQGAIADAIADGNTALITVLQRISAAGDQFGQTVALAAQGFVNAARNAVAGSRPARRAGSGNGGNRRRQARARRT